MGNTGRLKGVNNTAKYLSSITSPIPETTFKDTTVSGVTYNDKWGFSPSKYQNTTGDIIDNSTTNPTYLPSPKNTTQTILDITSTASSTPAEYSLAIGARANTNTTKDSYTGGFMVLAAANPVNYRIGYVDLNNGMPDTTAGTSSSDTISLDSTRPIKPYHVFTGWCSKPTTDNTCTDGTIYQPGSSYNIKTNEPITNLYAMWERVTNVLQNVDTWGDTLLPQVGNITYAYDNRDGRVYTVGRLADNKIWLLDNLAFSDTTLLLNSTNTNLPDDITTTIRMMGTGGEHNPIGTTSSLNDAYIYDELKNRIPTDELSTANGWRYGVLYNYCATSAGTICGANNTRTAQYSICPAGWRLPIGKTSGEYVNLYKKLGGRDEYNYDRTFIDNFRLTFHLPVGAIIRRGTTPTDGYSYLWTASSDGYETRSTLYLHTSILGPQEGSHNRSYEYSVRCVAGEYIPPNDEDDE